MNESNGYRLQLTDEPQVVQILGAPLGNRLVAIAFAVPPDAGTVTVEYRIMGADVWLSIPGGAAAPLAGGPVLLEHYGAASLYRVTFDGLVGGVMPMLWAGVGPSRGFPAGAFEGLRALTVQPYTEANVKNGLEYYVRAVWNLADPILAGTTRKLFFRTGVKPVIVKLRDFHYVAEQMTVRLYSGPTGVAGGTPLTIHNYNLINPVPTSILDARKNVTTTTDGTEIDGGDPEHMFGAQPAGQRSQLAIPEGRERIIPANATFIVAISNTGSGNALAQYFLDWYEGTPDLPLPA